MFLNTAKILFGVHLTHYIIYLPLVESNSQLIITWYGMGDVQYILYEVEMINSSFLISHLLY